MFNSLSEVVMAKLHRKMEVSQMTAKAAVEKMVQEGKASSDYIAYLGSGGSRDTELRFSSNGHVNVDLPTVGRLTIHDNAVGQLAQRFGVPTGYLRDLAKGAEWQKSLASQILNEHSAFTQKTRSLVRVVGEEVRGVLSDSYRRLNSQDLVMSFLEACFKQDAVLYDGHFDATRLYVETIYPMPLEIDTPNNGRVAILVGARLSTSDYGDGALEMRSFIMQGICLNGMVRESVMRQVHLGARLPENISLSEKTYLLDTQTQASAINDLSRNLFSKENITEGLKQIQQASAKEVDFDAELKNLAKRGVAKGEVEKIQSTLLNGKTEDGISGENTLWKFVNGITAVAREVDPRRARELQEIAGSMLK